MVPPRGRRPRRAARLPDHQRLRVAVPDLRVNGTPAGTRGVARRRPAAGRRVPVRPAGRRSRPATRRGGDGRGGGQARLDAQYWTANVDPSDRYVQSPPGSAIHRLRADEAGYQNMFLAGDWTNCGLNAGCIEAAVLSGLQAANAVRGRPLLAGIAGSWYGLGTAGSAATAPASGER